MEAERFSVIGFTLPSPHPEGYRSEASCIVDFLQSGAVDFFHIRKPDASLEYTSRLVGAVPSEYHSRLTLHSHFELFNACHFGGIHHKDIDISDFPADIRKSRSCHRLDELSQFPHTYTYSFLSPIYDSISKPGYGAAPHLEDPGLSSVLASVPVVALGGVIPEKFSQLFALKFAGAALLGYLWGQFNLNIIIHSLLKARKDLYA